MQAVILAAGRDTKMGDLTDNLPKTMIRLSGRPILEYILANLPEEISEIILVIGYRGDIIRNYFGGAYGKRQIRYIWQYRLDGTAGALMKAKKIIKDRFLVLNGDDLYHQADLKKMTSHRHAVLVSDVENPERFGVIELNRQGHLASVIEKPKKAPTGLVNAGVYVLDRNIFGYQPVAISEKEFGLPQTLAQMIEEFPIKTVKAGFWHPINSVEDLAEAEKFI